MNQLKQDTLNNPHHQILLFVQCTAELMYMFFCETLYISKVENKYCTYQKWKINVVHESLCTCGYCIFCVHLIIYIYKSIMLAYHWIAVHEHICTRGHY